MPVASGADSIGLVAVKPESDVGVVRAFSRTEHAGAFLEEDVLLDQLVNALARLEGGVQMDQGIGPEEALIEPLPALLLDVCVLYANAAADIRPVIVNQAIAKLEYVQGFPSDPLSKSVA
jgi:hypothetical protein